MMFGSSTATLWILLSKVYGPTTTTSTVCVYKPDFQLLAKGPESTQHTLSHSILKEPTHMEVHKMSNSFANHIILINVTLRSHWTLSNSEVSPRIWTCVTRPSRTHMHRLGTRVGGVRVTQRYPRLGTREGEVSKWYTGLGTSVGAVHNAQSCMMSLRW